MLPKLSGFGASVRRLLRFGPIVNKGLTMPIGDSAKTSASPEGRRHESSVGDLQFTAGLAEACFAVVRKVCLGSCAEVSVFLCFAADSPNQVSDKPAFLPSEWHQQLLQNPVQDVKVPRFAHAVRIRGENTW